MVYLLKMVDLSMAMLNNQMVNVTNHMGIFHGDVREHKGTITMNMYWID